MQLLSKKKIIQTETVSQGYWSVQTTYETVDLDEKDYYYDNEFHNQIRTKTIYRPDWDKMSDYPIEAINHFKSHCREDGTIYNGITFTKSLETMINEFLKKKQITKKDLIDIKYIMDNESYEYAMIIYQACT